MFLRNVLNSLRVERKAVVTLHEISRQLQGFYTDR